MRKIINLKTETQELRHQPPKVKPNKLKENEMRSLRQGFVGAVLLSGLAVFSMAATDSTTQTVTMNINEIAVVDVSAASLTLTLLAPATGGDTPANVTDSATYVKYTSTVTGAEKRTLSALMSAAAPAGTKLSLISGTPPGTNMGTAASQIDLNTTAQNIITNIGSGATGSTGAQLTYTLSVTDVSALVAGASSAPTVTLTLTTSQ